MAIRILCLHGMGVNSEIFATQTANFRTLLPSRYEFIFVQGLAPCDAAPGVAEVYPEPYLCWYNTPTTARVAHAHHHIISIMETDGPFDVVMGFSQGAALAASMLLHQQIEHPSDPPLFRAAIFICPPIPFSRSIEHGIDVRSYFGHTARGPIRPDCPTVIPSHLTTDKIYLRGESELNVTETGSHSINTDDVYYQMFHSTVDSVRISMPTAHIYGRQDQWRLHSMELVKLCDTAKTYVLEHDGGHEIPRDHSHEICDIIETVIASI